MDLSNNQIICFDPIINLTNLTDLRFRECNISDTNFLKGLVKLTYLSMYKNNINDITALSNLTNLEGLVLSDNNISDISALEDLTNLNFLILWRNNISDISALEGLTLLKTLFLEENKITNISPLISNSNSGGIGSSTIIKVQDNDLDLSEGSQDMLDIQTLIDNGVDISYDPQNSND